MKCAALALTAVVLAAHPAWASGGISCTIDEPGLELGLEAGTSRGMGSGLFSFRGALAVTLFTVPKGLAPSRFDLADVKQYWLDDRELRLLLYKEREGGNAHAYVEAEIRTEAGGEEGTYAGSFRLVFFEVSTREGRPDTSTEVKGRVGCVVE